MIQRFYKRLLGITQDYLCVRSYLGNPRSISFLGADVLLPNCSHGMTTQVIGGVHKSKIICVLQRVQKTYQHCRLLFRYQTLPIAYVLLIIRAGHELGKIGNLKQSTQSWLFKLLHVWQQRQVILFGQTWRVFVAQVCVFIAIPLQVSNDGYIVLHVPWWPACLF